MLKGLIKFGMKVLLGKRITSGVPAIIRNSKGEVLLGKRNKDSLTYPEFWGLPGGLIEYGETVEQAIKRELHEELGVDSEVIKYGKPLMNLPTKEYPTQGLGVTVYCKIHGIPQAKDETSEIRWFKPKEIKDMKLAYNHKEILKEEGILK
jgi:8-oxo-dGTP diphosphatase